MSPVVEYYDDESGEIRGYVCRNCGGDVVKRGSRAWCEWCATYVSTIRHKAPEPLPLSEEDYRWLDEHDMRE